jgi:IS5 family transposase
VNSFSRSPSHGRRPAAILLSSAPTTSLDYTPQASTPDHERPGSPDTRHLREDGTSTRDPEASFTGKHGETYHGYKASINADRSGQVTDYRYSDAAPHDSNFIDELTRDEKKMVVADSAYRSRAREAALRERGVCCALAFKR